MASGQVLYAEYLKLRPVLSAGGLYCLDFERIVLDGKLCSTLQDILNQALAKDTIPVPITPSMRRFTSLNGVIGRGLLRCSIWQGQLTENRAKCTESWSAAFASPFLCKAGAVALGINNSSRLSYLVHYCWAQFVRYLQLGTKIVILPYLSG